MKDERKDHSFSFNSSFIVAAFILFFSVCGGSIACPNLVWFDLITKSHPILTRIRGAQQCSARRIKHDRLAAAHQASG